MTDINGTVVGLQGFAVNNATPTDGYVLMWSQADGYWVPRPVPQPSTGLNKVYFTSSGTWTCPAGVTSILVIAAGGGGGGKGGSAGLGGIGGGGVLQQTVCVSVAPGTTYTITIGDGGLGSSGVNGNALDSSHGSSTTLKNGSTIIFSCRGGGGSVAFGNNFAETYIGPGVSTNLSAQVAAGGSYDSSGRPMSGNPNYLDMYIGGTGSGVNNTGDRFATAGSGGGAGPQGNGGDGGSLNPTGNGSNGVSAPANSGAGGGGGGGSGSNSGSGGNGGNGGSGYMYIIY